MPKAKKIPKSKQTENVVLTKESKGFVFDVRNVIKMNADNLTSHIMVRLSPGDAERLAVQAKKLGVKPTTFARIVILSYLRALEEQKP